MRKRLPFDACCPINLSGSSHVPRGSRIHRHGCVDRMRARTSMQADRFRTYINQAIGDTAWLRRRN